MIRATFHRSETRRDSSDQPFTKGPYGGTGAWDPPRIPPPSAAVLLSTLETRPPKRYVGKHADDFYRLISFR
jgi:hypothetical protein